MTQSKPELPKFKPLNGFKPLTGFLAAGAPRALAVLLLSDDPDTRAEAEAEWEALQTLRTAVILAASSEEKPTTSGLQWYLEHVYPQRYTRKPAELVDEQMAQFCEVVHAEVGDEMMAQILTRYHGNK